MQCFVCLMMFNAMSVVEKNAATSKLAVSAKFLKNDDQSKLIGNKKQNNVSKNAICKNQGKFFDQHC